MAPRPAWRHTPLVLSRPPACFWWVMVTATTVGYGDMSPTTPWGQLVGCATFYFGIMVLALPITIIGANYAEEYANTIDDEVAELEADVSAVDQHTPHGKHLGFLAGTQEGEKLPPAVSSALAIASR